ncbi:MAG: PAS domain-containing protein, partial [Gaiellaceae bacterium]
MSVGFGDGSAPALADPRELFETVLQAIGDGIAVLSPGGDWLFANEEAARLSGFASAEELTAASPQEVAERVELFHADGSPLAREELPGRRALVHGDPGPPVLVRFRHPVDGSDRVSRVTALIARDERDEPRYVIVVVRDVTSEHALVRRRRTAAEIGGLGATLDHEAALRDVAAAVVPRLADCCLVDLIGEGGLERVAAARFDVKRGEVVHELAGSAPPAEACDSCTRRVLDTGAADIVHSGGESYVCAPIRSGERVLGAVTLVSESRRGYDSDDVSIAEDIAGRAAAAIENAMLYREAQRMSAVLDSLYASAPIGLGFWDRDLRYVRVNDALARINDRSPEAHVGRSFAEVVPQ